MEGSPLILKTEDGYSLRDLEGGLSYYSDIHEVMAAAYAGQRTKTYLETTERSSRSCPNSRHPESC